MPKQVFGTRAAESRGPSYTTSTRTLQVAEDIIPIAELKVRLSEVVRSLDARGRPLVITLNGKPAAVLMAPRDYDRVAYHERVVAKIERGFEDAEAGRVISDEELGKRIDRRFGVDTKARARRKSR
jgi:prevent-host-death family protein